MASAINSNGYGSTHEWRYLGSLPTKVSAYQCARCDEQFNHWYDAVPNIFTAMREQGIRDVCPHSAAADFLATEINAAR